MRIVGGSDAPIQQAPWQISLRISNYHTCGGSIIDQDIIVLILVFQFLIMLFQGLHCSGTGTNFG